MSRSLTVGKDYQYIETIVSLYECKHMYDDVCCNDQSEHCADFVDRGKCAYCDLFEEEDGIIKQK